VQLITSLPQMLEGFDRIDALAGPSRLVVTGHDPEVARRFDEVDGDHPDRMTRGRPVYRWTAKSVVVGLTSAR
jgi:hypothetical protein